MMIEKSHAAPSLAWVAPTQAQRIRRSIEDKRKIVLQSLAANTSIASVARAHGINANLLHSWRWLFKRGKLGEDHSNTTLIPVKLSQDSVVIPKLQKIKSSSQDARLEIMIGEATIVVHGNVLPEVLQTVLKALQR